MKVAEFIYVNVFTKFTFMFCRVCSDILLFIPEIGNLCLSSLFVCQSG